jgi:hypothetical protein
VEGAAAERVERRWTGCCGGKASPRCLKSGGGKGILCLCMVSLDVPVEVELNRSILCRFRVLEVRFGYSWLRLEFQSVVFGYGFGSDIWGLGFLQEKSLRNFDLAKLVMSIPLCRTT